MYNEIKSRLEKRFAAQPRVLIERVSVAHDGERDPAALLSEHVADVLALHRRELAATSVPIDAHDGTAGAVSAFGGLHTRRQLEDHVVEHVISSLSDPPLAFDIMIPSGTSVIGTPYDRDYSQGSGLGLLARFDGKVITLPSDSGFSGAGIGFYLTVDQLSLVSITPQGNYDWNWSAWANLPGARSSGGLGITVYADADTIPVMSRQVILWSLSGATQFSGQKGSGAIANAASPSFGFGSVPLAPALVTMNPGSRYLVWVWAWQTSVLPPSAPFIAFLRFVMPFVTVSAGPPIIIH